MTPPVPFTLGLAPPAWIVYSFTSLGALTIAPLGTQPETAGLEVELGDGTDRPNKLTVTNAGRSVTVYQTGAPQLNAEDLRRFAEAVTTRA